MNIRNGLELITPETYGFIYMTYNTVNGRKYIGQKKIDKYGLWKRYIGSGMALRGAIKLYGRDKFYKDVIDTAKTQDELNEKETFWIRYYNAVADKVFYNLTDDQAGYKAIYIPTDKIQERRKEQTEACMEEMNRYHPRCRIDEDQAKEIVALLMDGVPATKIAKRYGISPGAVCNMRNHRTWKYLTENIEFPPPDMSRPETCRAVVQFDLCYNKIAEYSTSTEAANKLGYIAGCGITRAASHKTPFAHGFIWVYKDDKELYDPINEVYIGERKEWNEKTIKATHKKGQRKYVLQLDENNNVLAKYDSITDAARSVNTCSTNISDFCNHPEKRQYAAGYIWKFAEEGGDEVNGET